MSDRNRTVESVTVLGTVAEATLRNGQSSLLIVWLVAQQLRRSHGDYAIPRKLLIEALDSHDIFRPSYCRQLLRDGNGTFWHLGEKTVFLIGVRRVIRALRVRRGGGHHRQVITIGDLQGSAARRGALLGAAVRDDRPVSQSFIRTVTGLSARTQRRHRGRGSFAVDRQTGDVTLLVRALERSSVRAWVEHHRVSGIYQHRRLVKKRLPNLHRPPGERMAPGGRTKSILRGQALDFGEGTQTVPRVWFDSELAWMRCRASKLGVQEARLRVDPDFGFNVAYVRIDAGRWEGVRR